MTRELTYRGVGVDVDRAADALGRVRRYIDSTRTSRAGVIGGIGDFGGLIGLSGLRDPILVATTDGVGTKLEVARIMDRHEVVGADLVNHCVNDALAMGAEPLFFLDYYATGRLDPLVFERVVGAMAQACQDNGVALLGGETAEMPGMYADGVYDIAGFLVGAVERDQLLDKNNVREGDHCLALASTGLHTNGFTLARAIIERQAGLEGVEISTWLRMPRPGLREENAGDELLQPHLSYLRPIQRLRAAAELHAIAHITGGGWEGNIPRSLPDGLGVVIDRDSFPVPPIFPFLASIGEVAEMEQWNTWNMGVGMIAFVAHDHLDLALDALREYHVYRIGKVELARGDRRVRFA